MPLSPNFDRSKLEDLLKQRFFYDQSFAIYGGELFHALIVRLSNTFSRPVVTR